MVPDLNNSTSHLLPGLVVFLEKNKIHGFYLKQTKKPGFYRDFIGFYGSFLVFIGINKFQAVI